MNNFRNIILIIAILFFFPYFLIAQSEEIQSLNLLFNKLYDTENDSIKNRINNQIIVEIENNIYAYTDFKELKKIKGLFALISDDGYVKILTWGFMLSDNSNKYSGVVNYYLRETDRFYTEKLTHSNQITEYFDQTIFTSENWYGAVYYDIVHQKYKGKNYYLLLGYDGYNDFINVKLIDAIILNEDEYIKFGNPFLVSETYKPMRFVFKYAERLSMLLKYDREFNMIIWDHLSPSKPELNGYFEYYGPDMTYDALKFKKGSWIYIPDVIINK